MFDVRLKELRESRNLTQKDLANQLNLTQSTIAYYENGKKLPTTDNLMSIARFFGVSTDFLLGLSKYTPDIGNHTGMKEDPNYLSSSLTGEQRKLLHYFERLESENKEYIVGKMVELFKEQQALKKSRRSASNKLPKA